MCVCVCVCVCVCLSLCVCFRTSRPPQGSQCTTCAPIELACAAQVINSQPSQKIFYTPPCTPLLSPLSPTDTLRLCIDSLCNNHSIPSTPTLAFSHHSLPPSTRPTRCPAPTLNKQHFIWRRKKGAWPLSFRSLSVEVCRSLCGLLCAGWCILPKQPRTIFEC